MSFWDWFVSGGKTVEKATQAVIDAGDKLVFTEEERSDVTERQRELYFKFLELARNETSVKAVTRRILAFLTLMHWFLFMDIAVVLYLTGRTEQAKAVFAITTDMYWIVFAIAAFYFGAHLLGIQKGSHTHTLGTNSKEKGQ